MSYEKQIFENGKVLDASQLNHIEDGIVELSNKCVSVESQTLTDEQKAQARANIGVEPIAGITSDITPTQAFDAMTSGHSVIILHTTSAFGVLYFTNFNTALNLNVIFSSSIVQYNGVLGLLELVGYLNTDTWELVIKQVAEYGDIPVPTIKTTSEITPVEVEALMAQGKAFAISHTDANYGEMLFNSFVYSQAVGGIISSTVFTITNTQMCAQLIGNESSNTWEFRVSMLAGAEDIPTSLPNPNALTINGTAYDGSQAVDMTSSVNALIDEKLAEIPNASGVSF